MKSSPNSKLAFDNNSCREEDIMAKLTNLQRMGRVESGQVEVTRVQDTSQDTGTPPVSASLVTLQAKEDLHSHPSDEEVDPHFDIFKVRPRPAGKG